MSMTFGAQEGFALILNKHRYIELWNERHPNNEVGPDAEPEELIDRKALMDMSRVIRAYSDANCCRLDIAAATDDPQIDDDTIMFGTAVDADALTSALNENGNEVWVVFAPKTQDYFDAPYGCFEEMVDDILLESCLFATMEEEITEDMRQFVFDHIAYVGVVTFG